MLRRLSGCPWQHQSLLRTKGGREKMRRHPRQHPRHGEELASLRCAASPNLTYHTIPADSVCNAAPCILALKLASPMTNAGPESSRMLQEDWGELYTGKRAPGIFILDLKTFTVQRLAGTPEDSSVGQPVWSPTGTAHCTSNIWLTRYPGPHRTSVPSVADCLDTCLIHTRPI